VPTANIEGNTPTNPCSTNGVQNPTPDSIDSTGATVERKRNVPSISRQRSIDEWLQLVRRQELDVLWASFFYESNIAFKVVRHSTFIKAVTETAGTQVPNYHLPSYNALRMKMIVAKDLAVKAVVSERMRASISQYGVTICSDGWFDKNFRPLMNVMLVCPIGDVFWGSIDSTGANKNIVYITETITRYIEEVNPRCASVYRQCFRDDWGHDKVAREVPSRL